MSRADAFPCCEGHEPTPIFDAVALDMLDAELEGEG